VQISGRLSETTLGDVLGSLYRAKVTGVVRLTEVSGPLAGRMHGIYLSRGEVVAVDTPARVLALGEILRQRGLLDGAAHRRLTLRLADARNRKVGELLVEECHISPAVVGAALRQQLRARLDALFTLEEALVSFHVACAHARNPAPPLAPREYLHGRPRARDRGARIGRRGDEPLRRRNAGRRTEALTMLGLDEDASISDVTRAFRELASQVHPDRHQAAPAPERRAMEQRFAALSAAYHTLID
jgi:DnaJ-domain-containing protein 1